ncbi:centromere protein O-like [Anneissia japonica]|uniref:centromere protein O-like n=1 Tax=Anneissia japonica TaxID=1529436 RepID=UPI00142597BD|nr:centromere protein O-like [Anneissia japonica]
MERSRYHAGPLHDLQRLEDDENTEDTSWEKYKLKELEKEIQNLTNLRDKLTWELEADPGKLLQRLLNGDREQNERELASLGAHQEACNAITAAKKSKVMHTVNLYRLSGTSIHQVKKNVVRLMFDTFNRGSFFETYYLELEGSKNLKVGSHTLPHFIPIKRIADQHLNVSLQLFAQTLMNLLNAFVARRQFIRDLQNHFLDHLEEEINCSQSCDFCYLSLIDFPGLEIPLRLQLMFSLDKCHPGQIKVKKLSKNDRDLTETENQILSSITKSLFAAQMPKITPVN